MLRIVEIEALSDGLHRSQTYHGEVIGGYALIPEDMETPNFPFGEVEAAEVDGVMTVTKWTAGEVPEPDPVDPAKLREAAYNTQAVVEYDSQVLTVTQAATLWQYYAAEGSAKADELQVLIAAAKQTIRDQYPDEEAKAE